MRRKEEEKREKFGGVEVLIPLSGTKELLRDVLDLTVFVRRLMETFGL